MKLNKKKTKENTTRQQKKALSDEIARMKQKRNVCALVRIECEQSLLER